MKIVSFCILLIFVSVSCKQSFDPPFVSPATGYLVVEGVVNSGGGNTSIRLSRTSRLDNRALMAERSAKVTVEGQDNLVYNLLETQAGVYAANNLNFSGNQQYRLRIISTNGNDYLSDYASVVPNPAIDSVSWKKNADGIEFFVSTNNPQNNTRYYQWEYDETWQIVTPYKASLKIATNKLPSGREEFAVGYVDSTTFSYTRNIDTCWQSNSSNTLLIGSSATLVEDVIYLPINTISNGSPKLQVKYSVNVKQYAWTKDGYGFLERIKKNTEQLGSIFDAQPSQLIGNIRCITDNEEPVIGFFNVCNTQDFRVFLTRQQVGGWFYNSGCYELSIENQSDSIIKKMPGLSPTGILSTSSSAPFIITFGAAPLSCIDCRLTGTNVKPDFWR